MKYLLLGDEPKRLFVESDNQIYSVWYNVNEERWVQGKTELFDARIGYDPYEPDDSMYKYGATEYLLDIVQITKEEAEQFIQKAIDENELEKLLKQK